MKYSILSATLFILFVCIFDSSKAQKYDSTKINQSTEKYEECTHPGKYEPIGVHASCCTGKGDLTLSYSFMNIHYKGNRQGTYLVSDNMLFQQDGYMMAPNTMDMQMHELMVMYGISDRFSAMAMTSYNLNKMTMNGMPPDLMNEMTGMPMGSMPNMPNSYVSSGLGDTKVFLMYKLRRECRYNFIIGTGINIPTGSTTVNGTTLQGENTRLSYPMQIGTGTWDFLPRITYFGQRTVGIKNILSYGIEATADIKLVNNLQGYSNGDEYDLDAWISYKFRSWVSTSLRVKGITQNQITGFDPAIYPLMYNDPGANPQNFGGQWMNAYLGFNFYIDKGALKNLRFLLEYGIPVYQNLNGVQMSLQNSIHVGCKYSF